MPYKVFPLHYNRWRSINQRCYNPTASSYEWYGGRGITNYWKEDFKGFQSYLIETLGECPEGYTLDRKNSNLPYQPGNLQWASAQQQTDNRRKQSKQFEQQAEKNRVSGWKWVRVTGSNKWHGSYKGQYTASFTNPADAYLQVLSLRSFLRQ